MVPIEDAIIETLRSGPCCFNDLVTGLPEFSWAERFVTVDCMSRDRRVFLRQLDYSAYQVSLASLLHLQFTIELPKGDARANA